MTGYLEIGEAKGIKVKQKRQSKFESYIMGMKPGLASMNTCESNKAAHSLASGIRKIGKLRDLPLVVRVRGNDVLYWLEPNPETEPAHMFAIRRGFVDNYSITIL